MTPIEKVLLVAMAVCYLAALIIEWGGCRWITTLQQSKPIKTAMLMAKKNMKNIFIWLSSIRK